MVRGGRDPEAQQRPCHQLGQTAGGSVHDHRSARAADQLADAPEPRAVVAHALHAKHQIRPIERRDDDLRARNPEELQDVGAGGGSRASRQGDGHRLPEQVAHPIESPVCGTEFVPPFDDAVRLVDGQERHLAAGAGQPMHERSETLRGTIEEREPAAGRRIEHDAPLIGIELAVHVRGGDAAAPQRRDLVLHQ